MPLWGYLLMAHGIFPPGTETMFFSHWQADSTPEPPGKPSPLVFKSILRFYKIPRVLWAIWQILLRCQATLSQAPSSCPGPVMLNTHSWTCWSSLHPTEGDDCEEVDREHGTLAPAPGSPPSPQLLGLLKDSYCDQLEGDFQISEPQILKCYFCLHRLLTKRF